MKCVDSGERITILVYATRMSVLYTLYPIWVSGLWGCVDLYQSHERCIRDDPNRKIIIVRYFRKMDVGGDMGVDIDVMRRIREKYDKVVYFDDSDGAGDTRFEVMPYVDVYLKKQVFSSLDNYMSRLYGRQLFTQYYKGEFGVEDDRAYYRVPLRDNNEIRKLRLAWNIGIGVYPIRPNIQRLKVALVRLFGKKGVLWKGRAPRFGGVVNKKGFVHSHFGANKGRNTIDYQRDRFLNIISGNDTFKSGVVGKKEYDRNLRKSRLTLSPFGWGEICFRDFEAIMAGSVLVKPDMSHLNTWPNIYKPYETYIPVRWDGDDLVDKVYEYVRREDECKRIALNAQKCLVESFEKVKQRVCEVLEGVIV